MSRDLDGIEKNISKLLAEWRRMKPLLKPHWARFKHEPWSEKHHGLTNLFVESRRISPYLTGHADVIYYMTSLPTIVILIGLLVWRW